MYWHLKYNIRNHVRFKKKKKEIGDKSRLGWCELKKAVEKAIEFGHKGLSETETLYTFLNKTQTMC